MVRISQGLCFECGQDRCGNCEFCPSCLSGFPKQTELKHPVGGWRYVLVQTKPAIPGLAPFTAMRVGVYERSGKSEWVCCAETFAEAEVVLLKKWDRAMAASW